MQYAEGKSQKVEHYPQKMCPGEADILPGALQTLHSNY